MGRCNRKLAVRLIDVALGFEEIAHLALATSRPMVLGEHDVDDFDPRFNIIEP